MCARFERPDTGDDGAAAAAGFKLKAPAPALPPTERHPLIQQPVTARQQARRRHSACVHSLHCLTPAEPRPVLAV